MKCEVEEAQTLESVSVWIKIKSTEKLATSELIESFRMKQWRCDLFSSRLLVVFVFLSCTNGIIFAPMRQTYLALFHHTKRTEM